MSLAIRLSYILYLSDGRCFWTFVYFYVMAWIHYCIWLIHSHFTWRISEKSAAAFEKWLCKMEIVGSFLSLYWLPVISLKLQGEWDNIIYWTNLCCWERCVQFTSKIIFFPWLPALQIQSELWDSKLSSLPLNIIISNKGSAGQIRC